MVSAMGDKDGNGKGGFVLLDEDFKACSALLHFAPFSLAPRLSHSWLNSIHKGAFSQQQCASWQSRAAFSAFFLPCECPKGTVVLNLPRTGFRIYRA